MPSQWRHRTGSLNPADDESRGLSVHQLLSSERLFSGPAFLLEPEEEWPKAEFGEQLEDNLKVKNEKAIFTLTALSRWHELLVRYSSWTEKTEKGGMVVEVQSIPEAS